MTTNKKMGSFVAKVAESVDQSLRMISSIVRSGNDFDNSLISDEAFKAINNPDDKKKLDEAVDYLQRHSSEQSREVELSNKKITISIG